MHTRIDLHVFLFDISFFYTSTFDWLIDCILGHVEYCFSQRKTSAESHWQDKKDKKGSIRNKKRNLLHILLNLDFLSMGVWVGDFAWKWGEGKNFLSDWPKYTFTITAVTPLIYKLILNS